MKTSKAHYLEYLRQQQGRHEALSRYHASKREQPKKHEPIYRGENRKHMVSQVMDTLRDWRMSHFENEAPCRAAIRSALCLQGYAWDRADGEAASIIATAFTFLGYARPSHDEGQREYVIPRENCSWCGVDLPEELDIGGKRTNFCSEVCARSALTYRDYGQRRHESEAFRDAWYSIMRLKNDTRACEHCNKRFRPLHSGGRYCSHKCATDASSYIRERPCKQCGEMFRPKNSFLLYCSRKCSAESMRTVPDKVCQQCGETFRPRNNMSDRGMFCSRRCVVANIQSRRVPRVCECCGSQFFGNRETTRFCGMACNQFFLRIEKGKTPRTFVPLVFDYFFKQAA